MRTLPAILCIFFCLAAGMLPTPAYSQAAASEDLAACTGAHAAPASSGPWAVPFCNQTGHDLVLQFHENDCPAGNWSRRGDVYEKRLRPGAIITVFLCYANEPRPATAPPPGTPLLRIPGGKGVVTTWSVVGDCGERSDRSRLDAHTFYDRGTYDSGIVLLQYPHTTPHCFGNERGAVEPDAANPDAIPTPPAAGNAPAGSSSPGSQGAAQDASPALSAVIDATDRFTRTVHVLATSGAGAPDYQCEFRLALLFSDGSDFSDRVRLKVPAGMQHSAVATRKYGKSVTRVAMGSAACAPM